MTQPFIDTGDLVVLGLVQEQHPERAQLYAQWRELDWPIMWDPFNTTGALAVPNAYLIDEHGILQGKRLNQEALATFMEAEYEAPAEPAPKSDPIDPNGLQYLFHPRPNSPTLDATLEFTLSLINDDELLEPQAFNYFYLGVLYRMRYDSEFREEGDFQHAIDAWERALELDPNQYIWRRRIQQYGPMSDKPYPFYDWVETAQREIRERGEVPVEIPQALTQAELGTEGSALVPDGDATNPDPDARITADDTGIVTVTSATTPDTQHPGSRRVLIEFTTGEAGHWNNEAEPLTVWIDADALSEGWSVESPLLIHAPAPGTQGDDPAATSDEPRIIDFGLAHPADAAGTHTLTGYALYNICEAGDLGQCLYRRQAFEVVVELD